MLGLASQRTVDALARVVSDLETRVRKLEVDWDAQVAALENAADLRNRAAARFERSKPVEPIDEEGQLQEIRRRRGGW